MEDVVHPMKRAARIIAGTMAVLAGVTVAGTAILLRVTATPKSPYFPVESGIATVGNTEPPIRLGVVELTDRGTLHEGGRSRQVEPILEALRSRASFLVVFVHGWHHDVSGATRDLNRFRDSLAANWRTDDGAGPEQVVGVFLGWRGASNRLPHVRHLTYGGRYRAARRIGRSGETADLVGDLIEAARSHEYRSRVVLIAHSMGGMILEQAYASHLRRLLEEDDSEDGKWCYRNHGSLADSVLLVNSDSDWRESRGSVELFARVHEKMFPPGSHYQLTNLHRPVVTYINAVTDEATGRMHPFGQTALLLRPGGEAVAQRRALWTHRPHKVNAPHLLPGDEAGAFKVTLDNHRDMFYFHPSGERGYAFVKYSGEIAKVSDEVTRIVVAAFDDPCVMAGRRYYRTSTDYHPVWSVPIVPDMVDGHSDIWHSKMRLLVTRFSQFTRLSPPADDDRGELGPLIRELARPNGWGEQIGNISRGQRLRSQARVSLERRAVRDPDHLVQWLRETRREWIAKEPRRTRNFDYNAGIAEIDYLLSIYDVPETSEPASSSEDEGDAKADETVGVQSARDRR